MDYQKLTRHDLYKIEPKGEDSNEYHQANVYYEDCWYDWTTKNYKKKGMIEARNSLNKAIREVAKEEKEALEKYNKAIEIKERVAGQWLSAEKEEYKKNNDLQDTYKVTGKLYINGGLQVFIIDNPNEYEKNKAGSGYHEEMPKSGQNIIYDFQEYLIMNVGFFSDNFGSRGGLIALVVRKLKDKESIKKDD